MIADVAFDAPVAHPFSYRVPEGVTLAPGQRVVAPLPRAAPGGLVPALRAGAEAGFKPIRPPPPPPPPPAGRRGRGGGAGGRARGRPEARAAEGGGGGKASARAARGG